MTSTSLIQNTTAIPVKPDLPLSVTFAIAGFSSMIGATAVFPIDKVKTRLQSGTLSINNLPHKPTTTRTTGASLGSAFRSITYGVSGIFKSEGFKGLYKGLTPQLVGITPEKAIKITTNDLLKKLLRKYENKPKTAPLSLPSEMLAGVGTGFIQVFATNPYEVVKIRMQIQTKSDEKKGPLAIIRELKLKGLYKGLSATMLRDVPFNAIYFSSYAVFKALWATTETTTNGETNTTTAQWKTFVSGIAAGTLAAGIDTPADTIKTRLQSGKYGYKGITDAFSTIVKKEGISGLFKGLLPRVLVIAPLFSITFTVFETLQSICK